MSLNRAIGGSHAEPHIPCYEVQHLKVLMRRVIESSLAGRWLEGTDEEIIRSVGFDEQGQCVGIEQEL